MSEFKSTVEGFREALKQEGERSAAPGLADMLRRERAAEPPPRVLWAMAIASLLAMIAVPVYQGEQRKRAASEQAAQEQADELLFEQVSESLSRPVAGALVPLLGPGN